MILRMQIESVFRKGQLLGKSLKTLIRCSKEQDILEFTEKEQRLHEVYSNLKIWFSVVLAMHRYQVIFGKISICCKVLDPISTWRSAALTLQRVFANGNSDQVEKKPSALINPCLLESSMC